MEFVPVHFGLKYKPAKLGVQYYINGQPENQYVHEIPLQFITRETNVEQAVKSLFEKHK